MADKKIKIDIEAVDNFSSTINKLKQKVKELNDTKLVPEKGTYKLRDELGNLFYDVSKLLNMKDTSNMGSTLDELTKKAKKYIKELEIARDTSAGLVKHPEVLSKKSPLKHKELGKPITEEVPSPLASKLKQSLGYQISDKEKKDIEAWEKKQADNWKSFQDMIKQKAERLTELAKASKSSDDIVLLKVKEDKKSIEDTKKKIKDTFKDNKVTQKVDMEVNNKVKNTGKEKVKPTETKIKKETVVHEKPKKEVNGKVEAPKVEQPQTVTQMVKTDVKAEVDKSSVQKAVKDIQKEVDKTPIKPKVEINKKDIGKQIVDAVMKEADSQVADMKNMFTNMVKSATKPAKQIEEQKEQPKKEIEKKSDIEIAKTPYGRKKQAEEARKVLYPDQYESKPKEVAKEVKEVDKAKEERLKRLRAANEEIKKQMGKTPLKEPVELELDKASVSKVNKEAQKELEKKPVKVKKPEQQSLFDESTPTLPSKISKIPVDEKLTKGIQQLPVEGILKKIDLDKNAMNVIAKTLNNLTGNISNISVDNNVLSKAISKTIKDINKTPYTIKIGKDEKYFTKILNDNIKKASKEVISLKAKIDKVGYDKETLNKFNKELNIKAVINSIKIDYEKLQKIKDRVVKFKAEITNVKINPDSLTAIKDKTINIKGVIKPLTIDKEALDKLKEKEIKLNGVVKGVRNLGRDSSPSKQVKEQTGGKEKDSYKTLLRQRNNAVVAMDKAWQQAGGNAKNAQFLKARKDYFNAQDRLMNFQSASGLSGLDKVIRDLERRLSLFSSDSKSPIKAAMEKKLSEAYTKQSQLQNQSPKGLEQLTTSTDNFVNSVAKLAQSLDNARTRILDYENKVRKAIENAKINEEVAKDLETTRHLDIVRKGEQAAAKAKKDAENKAIAEQAAKEVEQQKLLNKYLDDEAKRKAAILKQGVDEEIREQKLVNKRQEMLELMAKEAAAWNRVERARDRILAQQDKMSMKNYLQQQATDAIGKPLSTTSRDNFLVDLQMYRDMTNDMSTNFYKKMGQALRIGKDHPYFEALQKLHKESLEAAKAWNESEKKKEKATKESAQNIKSQYQSLAQKAKEFATEAEKAWRMQGNQTSPVFDSLREQFHNAMQNLVNYRRNLGNLSAGAEANVYANMARSLGKASPMYDELIRKAKQLKKEQKEINDALKTKTTGDDFHGFSAGNFAIGFIRFVGRAAKGWGSALEAFSVVFDNLRMMGGKLGVLGTVFSVFAAGVTGVVTVLNFAAQGLQFFGNTLIQIGQSIYQALQPGIELYKQQQSAIFSFTAALKSNGVVADETSPFYGQRLSTMGDEGTSIARGLSASLIQRATLDAEMSAFNLEELLRSLQGTLPLLLGRGMSVEQDYEVNKGVAGVAKLTQLTPSQILQETRDLAQGSITSRGSQVANALGITNADLEQYKGNADALFNFLMEKFKAYGELLQEFEDTALGRWQQLQERYQNVTKTIVEGIAPMFKGVFEEIINWTGQWQDKNGNYLDAIAGVWKDKNGEIIGTIKEVTEAQNNLGVDMKSVEFIPSEELQKVKKALMEIIVYVAGVLDALIAWGREILGTADPIDVIKQLILDIVQAFLLCLSIIGSFIENFAQIYAAAVEIVDTVLSFAQGLIVVKSIVKGVALGFWAIVRVVANVVRLIWNGLQIVKDWLPNLNTMREMLTDSADVWGKLLSGDFSGAWETAKASSEKFRKGWSKDVSQNLKTDLDDSLEAVKDTGTAIVDIIREPVNAGIEGGKQYANIEKARKKLAGVNTLDKALGRISGFTPINGDLQQAVQKYKEATEKLKQQGNTQGLQHGDIKGVPKEDTKEAAKAAKQALKEAQKALKEAIEKLKQELKDKLDELKEAQEKDDIAYKEGFMSMKDYYTQKALREQEEAQLRLAEAEAERELLIQTPFENEYDRQKELHKVNREIREYSRAVEKTGRQLGEVERQLGKYNKAMQVMQQLQRQPIQTMMNGKSNYVRGHTEEKLAAFGAPKEYIDAVQQYSAKYANEAVDADALAKIAIAVMKQESNFNPTAGSSAGAYGLMQLMEGTAQGLGVNRYDVMQNIEGGVKELARLLKVYDGDIRLALAGYNAGQGAVSEYGGVPPYKETQNYVVEVQNKIAEINKQDISQAKANGTTLGTVTGNSITDAIEIALRGVGGQGGYLGQTLMHGRVACVEAGTKLGAYYSDAFKEAVNKGIVNTDVLDSFFDEKGIPSIEWDKGKLKPGDIIFFDSADVQNQHVMLYKGDNFVTGNFSSRNSGRGAVGEQNLDEYLKYSGLTPTHIRQTGTYGLASGFGQELATQTQTLKDIKNIIPDDFKKELAEVLGVDKDEKQRATFESLFRESANTTKFGHEVNEEALDRLQKLYELREKNTSRVSGNVAESNMLLMIKYARQMMAARSDPEMLGELKLGFQLEKLDLAAEKISKFLDTNLATIEDKLKVDTFKLALGEIDATAVSERISQALSNKDDPVGIAKYIEDLETVYQDYVKRGMIEDAQRIKNKIQSIRDTLLGYFDKMRETVSQPWEMSQKIFSATPKYTSTQREFAEREFTAYKAQAELAVVDNALKTINQQLDESSQKTQKWQEDLASLKESQAGLNTEIETEKNLYDKLQGQINDVSNQMTTEAEKQKDLEYKRQRNLQEKEYLELLKQQPQYLADIANAANEALDKGLNELLTDGVNSAKSLGELLKDLAVTVLKEIQRVSAKWIVKGIMNKLVGHFYTDEKGNSQMGVQKTTQQLVEVNKQLNETGQRILQAIEENSNKEQQNTQATQTDSQTTQTNTQTTQQGIQVDRENTQAIRENTQKQDNTNVSASGTMAGTGGMGGSVTQGFGFTQGHTGATGWGKNGISNFLNSPIFGNILDFVNGIIGSAAMQLAGSVFAISTLFNGDTKEKLLSMIFLELQLIYQNVLQIANLMMLGMQSAGWAKGGLIKPLKLAGGGTSSPRNTGFIRGAGTATSDSIPAMLSNGEYVINAKSTSKYGRIIEAINNDTLGHYATGGLIGGVWHLAPGGQPTPPSGSGGFGTSGNNNQQQNNNQQNNNQQYDDTEVVEKLDRIRDVVETISVRLNQFVLLFVLFVSKIYNAVEAIRLSIQGEGTKAPGGLLPFLASGGIVYKNDGLVTGYGTSTSDDIPAMLSNGEAVLNAKAVKKLGTNFINAVNNGEFSKIRATIPHFASGGVVGEAQQFTARGMTDFAKGIGTEVSTTNNMNIALVRDENEAMESFMRSPQGERIMANFQKKSAHIFYRS